MRCMVHATDHTSSNGVCASCLRDRLFAVLAAKAQADARAQTPHVLHSYRKSDTNPPPLHFPKSVSPYISRRKSDTAPHHHHHRHDSNNYPKFFSTPQIGPTAAHQHQKKKNKFSLLLNLFKSKTGKRVTGSDSNSFPSMFSEDEDDDEHCRFESNGYSSEEWKNTPKSSATSARSSGGGGRMSHVSWNVYGIGFCLSPLVRVSSPEVVVSGEVRVQEKQFCKNRSRKLVDFGRHGRKH